MTERSSPQTLNWPMLIGFWADRCRHLCRAGDRHAGRAALWRHRRCDADRRRARLPRWPGLVRQSSSTGSTRPMAPRSTGRGSSTCRSRRSLRRCGWCSAGWRRPSSDSSGRRCCCFVLLWVSAKLTLDLVGREGLLPALVLPALSPAVMAEFSPGRIDHHSIQIILALTMAWCTVRAVRDPRWAIGAGLAAATAMAIAVEAVPAVIATVLGFGLLWVLRRERAGAMVMFGVTLAGASLIHLAIALAAGPVVHSDVRCDVDLLCRGGRGGGRCVRDPLAARPQCAGAAPCGGRDRRWDRGGCAGLLLPRLPRRTLRRGRSLARRQLAEPHRRGAAGVGEFCAPFPPTPSPSPCRRSSDSW